jgi:hypothetical protein
MLLDKFELREFDREVIDVVAVLHLVEAVGKPPYPCPQIGYWAHSRSEEVRW